MRYESGDFTRSPRRLIVIGASAGGIAAVSRLLSRLPASLDAAVVFAMHLPRNRPSQLAEILARMTRMEVVEASNDTPLKAGAVYTALPGQQLRFREGRIQLSEQRAVDFFSPSIDILFSSAADCFGDGVVAVQLTGRLNDGVDGLIAVRRAGGLTIVQDPAEAAYRSMPDEAIRSDRPDFVLPLDGIADKLIELVAAPAS